jgi:hypothetical protein
MCSQADGQRAVVGGLRRVKTGDSIEHIHEIVLELGMRKKDGARIHILP